MDHAQREAFDQGRDLSGKAVRSICYAPFTSMYLDPHGDVLACCQNTEHILGNVAQSSLLEIWHGRPAEELRAALEDYDHGLGCQFCAWQVADGNVRATYAESFEAIRVEEARPAWPRRLEFAISNTCNLECVMCNGEWSSKIRSRREGRAPLPKVYGDRFFEELRPFLHHLHEARFLGGEPFLAAETLRIMDLIVDEGLEVPCHLTTNGTQWNDRVERILERLPVSIAVSLDGATRETVEAIRVGASYDQLLENLRRYRSYTDRRGTTLDLTFCLMKQNWREFGDYLRFADDWRCRVFINTVIHPRFSLFHLPLAEFDELLEVLDAQDAALREHLTINRDVWSGELARLHAWSDQAHQEAREVAVDAPYRPVTPRAVYFREQVPAPLPSTLRSGGAGAHTEDDALAVATAGMGAARAGILRCDADDVVVEVLAPPGDPRPASFMDVPADSLVGRPFVELAAALAQAHGDHVHAVRDEVTDGAAIRQVVYRSLGGTATYLQVCSYPLLHAGEPAGSLTAGAWTTEAPDWAPSTEP